ncbi:MAG: tRNA N6-adenosine threonylcarbamoyltransferase [Parcubacteria group bacterium LiPW_41]|nr:MAG: tRNA N6-adenosine threonylcarbamoyltransferase [Parcubacteria group bacterium LiPW_41]
MQMMRILAIETSCDETAFSLVEASGGLLRPTFSVLENLVTSQIAIHRPFGGVVPNLAKREHLVNLPILFEQIKEKIGKKKIDIVAVTVGPGLEPALWTGVGFAKEIHKKYFPKSKLIGVNHMEGHLYSFLLSQKTEKSNFKFQISKLKELFPAIALVVSGGHTIIIRMDSLTKRKKLGETRDDAVGEAFDKVARLLNLPYPGGPEIERCAKEGNPHAIEFPRPMMHDKNYEFSFSGLKTSALYYMRDHKTANINDVAASFQEAAIDVLRHKATRAIKEFNAHSLLLSGGVAASKALRTALEERCKELNIRFFAPSIQYNTDNATMIAVAAYINFLEKKNRALRANGNMAL